jgi:hypothetical protein
MRLLRWFGGAAVLPCLLVACTSTAPEEPDLPSLAEAAAASSAAAPPATGIPGPPLTAACPLLSGAEVTKALGQPVTFAREDPAGSGPDGASYICTYGFTDGHAMLIVSHQAASAGTPQQAVDRSVQSYQGSLQTLSGLGDAALYNDGTGADWEFVTSAKLAGPEVRTVHVAAFTGGDLRAGLIELVGTVLGRI